MKKPSERIEEIYDHNVQVWLPYNAHESQLDRMKVISLIEYLDELHTQGIIRGNEE